MRILWQNLNLAILSPMPRMLEPTFDVPRSSPSPTRLIPPSPPVMTATVAPPRRALIQRAPAAASLLSSLSSSRSRVPPSLSFLLQLQWRIEGANWKRGGRQAKRLGRTLGGLGALAVVEATGLGQGRGAPAMWGGVGRWPPSRQFGRSSAAIHRGLGALAVPQRTRGGGRGRCRRRKINSGCLRSVGC